MNPELAELEDKRRRALDEAGPSGALVIHLLSHGFRKKTGALYVLATDSDSDDAETSVHVESWLQRVEDSDRSPAVLLLLDVCHAGAPVDAQWRLRLPTDRRKTWVIGAATADQEAFRGRFSQAVTAVLRQLRDGAMDLDPSVEWVPLDTLTKSLKRELTQRCGRDGSLPQSLTVDLIDPAKDPSFPFFRNPAYEPDAKARYHQSQERLLRGFLAELDAVLDPWHYLSRALGRIDRDQLASACCFSGRQRELALLARWLDGDTGPQLGLRVVAGSPGAGKSALLGVLVCAAHPQLSEFAKAVRNGVHGDCLPGRNEQLAAVHARGRQLGEVAAALARQLDLGQPDGEPWTPAGLVEALRERPGPPPVIIVDALDEAENPRDLQDLLLLPLTRACRLLSAPVHGPSSPRCWRPPGRGTGCWTWTPSRWHSSSGTWPATSGGCLRRPGGMAWPTCAACARASPVRSLAPSQGRSRARSWSPGCTPITCSRSTRS